MPKTVVIIDDDPDDLDVMKDALKEVDPTIHCISFISPEEALHLLSTEFVIVPDFVFIDINMIKLSGDQCLRELKKLPEFADTPIVMCSTSMPERIARELLQDGAAYVFQKPFGMKEYIRILERILYGYHQRGTLITA